VAWPLCVCEALRVPGGGEGQWAASRWTDASAERSWKSAQVRQRRPHVSSLPCNFKDTTRRGRDVIELWPDV
jgi:hypothetical protein